MESTSSGYLLDYDRLGEMLLEPDLDNAGVCDLELVGIDGAGRQIRQTIRGEPNSWMRVDRD